jgi:putative aminopeptidase FrvX
MMVAAGLINHPDIHIEFTEDEEMYMDGARAICKKYDPKDTFIIVLDVTVRGKSWDKINFTVENFHGIHMRDIKKALKGFNYKIQPNGTESEAWLYKEMGFACLEIDIPVMNGLHSLDGRARIEDIMKAIDAVRSVHEYLKNKTREQISDTLLE